jgi:hypothetical protein
LVVQWREIQYAHEAGSLSSNVGHKI